MNEIKIKIHSLVDVITNSSTVIYVQSTDNTIKYAKDLINSLLEATNSDKKADDLFTFHFDIDRDEEIESIVNDDFEAIIDIEDEFIQLDQPTTIKELREMSSADQDKTLNLLLDKIRDGKISPYSGYGSDSYDWDTRSLLITPKNNDKKTINLTEQFQKIFNIDGSRDG